jgi:hypothetical protein
VRLAEACGFRRTECWAAEKCSELDGRDLYRKSTGEEVGRWSTAKVVGTYESDFKKRGAIIERPFRVKCFKITSAYGGVACGL